MALCKKLIKVRLVLISPFPREQETLFVICGLLIRCCAWWKKGLCAHVKVFIHLLICLVFLFLLRWGVCVLMNVNWDWQLNVIFKIHSFFVFFLYSFLGLMSSAAVAATTVLFVFIRASCKFILSCLLFVNCIFKVTFSRGNGEKMCLAVEEKRRRSPRRSPPHFFCPIGFKWMGCKIITNQQTKKVTVKCSVI